VSDFDTIARNPIKSLETKLYWPYIYEHILSDTTCIVSTYFLRLLQFHNLKNLCMEFWTTWATLKRNSYCNRGLISVSTEGIKVLSYEQNGNRRRKHQQRYAIYI
jgi:hypothetical protein